MRYPEENNDMASTRESTSMPSYLPIVFLFCLFFLALQFLRLNVSLIQNKIYLKYCLKRVGSYQDVCFNILSFVPRLIMNSRQSLQSLKVRDEGDCSELMAFDIIVFQKWHL
jgi:hypothetical protein